MIRPGSCTGNPGLKKEMEQHPIAQTDQNESRPPFVTGGHKTRIVRAIRDDDRVTIFLSEQPRQVAKPVSFGAAPINAEIVPKQSAKPTPTPRR